MVKKKGSPYFERKAKGKTAKSEQQFPGSRLPLQGEANARKGEKKWEHPTVVWRITEGCRRGQRGTANPYKKYSGR